MGFIHMTSTRKYKIEKNLITSHTKKCDGSTLDAVNSKLIYMKTESCVLHLTLYF